MNIKVNLNNKQIRVQFDNELIPIQTYDLGKNINLTDLVKYTSDINNYITTDPQNLEEFIDKNRCEDKEILKIVEYIYRVFEAYNKSYQEVCADKET